MGRVVKDAEVKELSNGKTVVNVRLAVRRPFKNMEGTYDTDFFNISFWDFLVDIAVDRIKKGVAVCVKGRLQIATEELASGYKLPYPVLIGERIMFFEGKPEVSLNETE